MPILLGALLKKNSIKANADIPIKAKYMIKDCKLWAEKNKIDFKFNNYFPIFTLKLMRCALLAEEKKIFQVFVDNIFDSIWEKDLNLNDEKILKKILQNMKIDSENFLVESENLKIKDELKKRTEDAYIKGIFGVPSFIVNNKIFWGQDRLEFVLREAKR